MNDFEKKLTERLDNPPVDQETGSILEAEEISGSYESALKRQLVPDQLYQSYVKYHGKLNALPHEELVVKELINPNTGLLWPLRSWPTKKSRAASSAHWSAYNLAIQKPGEEVTISPCADPEGFVQNAMRNCMALGQKNSRWTPRQALRKCGKQIDMLKQAVYDYCNGEGGEEFLQSLLKQMVEENPDPSSQTDMFKSIKDKLE